MKKSSILILIIICLVGCKKGSNETTITGEIKGLGTDTLYLYGMDELYDRIDTIYVENDKFSYTTSVDTITSAYLLLKNRIEYPVFLDKGNKIKIKGDTINLNFLTISGNIYNEEFTDFQKALEDPADPSEKAGEETVDKRTTVEKANTAEEMAEEFILQHHSSYVSLYLLDKYFVQKETPDFSKIKKLVEVMTGVLQDKPYIERLNETITQAEKSEIGKYAPFFSLPNAKGEKITRSSDAFKQKSLLINFWASWNDSISQKQSNSELREIYKKYKKNKYIGMLGISLDVDKQQWKDAIKRDTLDWEQVCDFGGLNSEVAKQYSIYKIPANILLSSDGKILAKNLRGEELKKKIENIVEEATEKEKKNEINKHKISQIIITVLPFVALAVLFVVFVAVVTMKGYRLDMYLKIVFNEGVVLAVVATGAIFIYTLGTFDISLGAATLFAATMGVVTYNKTEKFVLMILVIFVVGIACSLFNSVLASIFHIPAFVTTVAMMSVLSASAAQIITTKGGALGGISIPSVVVKPYDNMVFKIIMLVVFYVICFFIFNLTKAGRRQKFIGGNPICAALTGIEYNKYTIIAFVMAGIGVGLGALLTLIYTPSVTTTTASSIGMNIFIAIVFGGMPISGGARSRIHAALVGGFSFMLLNDILELVIDGSAAYGITQLISAIFFLVVVYVTSMNYRSAMLPR